MAAFLDQVADCVLADFLGAFELSRISQPIKAQRGLIPIVKAGDLPYGEYHVNVAPISEKTKRTSRTTLLTTYSIEIGVVCRLQDTAKASTDPGQELLEELSLYHFDYGLSNSPAVWTENDIYFWGDPDVLASDGVFFGLWNSMFQVARERRP